MLRKEDQWVSHEVKEITFFVLLGIFMTVIMPLVFGFAMKSFEESFQTGRPLQFGDFLTTYIIYYIMIFGAMGLAVLKVREMFITNRGEHPSSQSKPSIASVAYLHDPEQDGLLYNLSESLGFKGRKNFMHWSQSILRNFIIWTLVFGGIGILQLYNHFAFVGVPQIPFQVTAAAKVFFTAEPAAFAETMLFILIFSIGMGFVGWFTSKTKLGKVGYYGFGVLVCVAIGLGWMGFHNIVYGNNEAALLSTFIFGFGGSMLTLLSGTFIPWYCWHFFNNTFVKLSQVATRNEDVIFVAAIFWFVLLVSWISGELLLRKYKRKQAYEPQAVN